jgi:hypothetical protein
MRTRAAGRCINIVSDLLCDLESVIMCKEGHIHDRPIDADICDAEKEKNIQKLEKLLAEYRNMRV